jgi:hypothetical protein
VNLPLLTRIGVVALAGAVIGVTLLIGPGRPGAAGAERPAGRTAQGETIRLRLVGGDLRSLDTRVRLRCTDGQVRDVRWAPGASVAGIHGAGTAVSVLQIDRAAGVTARLDGDLGGRPHGTIRAIGAYHGVRCDSGAVRWSL